MLLYMKNMPLHMKIMLLYNENNVTLQLKSCYFIKRERGKDSNVWK